MERNNYIMKNLITLAIILITLNVNSQRLINTENKYSSDIQYNDEGNDCSVRAFAEAFDIKYDEALSMLKEEGRQQRKGMRISQYIKAIKKTKAKVGRGINAMSPKEFIENIAQGNNSYIVVTKNHTFVIEKYRGEFAIKGNNGDREAQIIGYAYVSQN